MPRGGDRSINWNRIVFPYITSIGQIAKRLVTLGWSERNAGNFSIRIGTDVLLTKITGARMMRIAKAPLPYLCLVRILQKGIRYQSLIAGKKPTKELPAHILGQRILMKHRPTDKALLHTHPPELIQLTGLYADPKEFVHELIAYRNSLKGLVGIVSFFEPGSIELARATARGLKNYRVIVWMHHGVIASGRTLFHAFRLINRVARVAQRLLGVKIKKR